MNNNDALKRSETQVPNCKAPGLPFDKPQEESKDSRISNGANEVRSLLSALYISSENKPAVVIRAAPEQAAFSGDRCGVMHSLLLTPDRSDLIHVCREVAAGIDSMTTPLGSTTKEVRA